MEERATGRSLVKHRFGEDWPPAVRLAVLLAAGVFFWGAVIGIIVVVNGG